MESITSLKNAATRAIWGDEQSHQEPISGQTGDVAKGEPYDAGNMEPSDAKAKFTAPDETGTQPVETEYSKPNEIEEEPKSKLEPESKAEPETKLEPRSNPEPKTKLETESKPEPEPKLEPEAKAQPTLTPQVNPTELKGSSNMHGDSTKAQNDVRDPTDPATQHENVAAKKNGGDAGKNGSNEHVGSHSKLAGEEDTESDDGHRNSGTGELYVNRGLVPKGSANGHANGHDDGSPKEKTSLKAKIKAKLHRDSPTAA